jgi:hypothetical protein
VESIERPVVADRKGEPAVAREIGGHFIGSWAPWKYFNFSPEVLKFIA